MGVLMRYALIAALVALCAALGWLWVQSGTIVRLQGDNDRLEASVTVLELSRAQALAAQKAADALAETQRRRAVAFQLQIENVLTTKYGGCADAAIDPDLLRDLGGVRLAPAPH